MSRSAISSARLVATLCSAAVLFGAFMMIFEVSRGYAWRSSAMIGLIAAGAGAVTMGLLVAWNRRRGSCPVEPGLGNDQRQLAARAAYRGEVPADPAVRQAAVRFARQHLERARRYQTAATLLLAVLLVTNVVEAVTMAPSYWYAVGLWGILLALRLWLPAHQRRRIRLLETAEPARPAPAPQPPA